MSACGFHLFLAYNDFHISCILSISVVIIFLSSGVSILRLTVRRSGLRFWAIEFFIEFLVEVSDVVLQTLDLGLDHQQFSPCPRQV